MAILELPLTPKSSSAGTPKSELKGRRNPGYKRIRWREYDPGRKVANSTPDQFVQWQPPEAASKDMEVEERSPSKTSKATAPDRGTVTRLSIWDKLASPPPSPLQPLPINGIRDDPFIQLPIKRTECVMQTMDYFITICHGIEGDSVVPRTPNPHLSMLLPFALQHSILFESIIAVCRASVLLSLGKSAFEDPHFIQHRGSALAALNTKLQSKSCTDDAALLTVTMLLTLEYLTGNQYGVQMHCRGLEQMLHLRGPISEQADSPAETDWIRFVKAGLIAYKALGSFVTGEAPDIPASSLGFASETFEALNLTKPLWYPEKPFSEDLCIVLSRLPSGFSELALTSRISEQMINTLASIGAAQAQYDSPASPSRKQAVNSIPSPEASEAGSNHRYTPMRASQSIPPLDAFDMETQRQRMTVQNLLSALQRMSLMSPNILETYISFGLISFLFQFRRLAPLNLFYDPMLRRFITVLPYHTKPSAIEEQHVLIWTSLSVAGALALRVVAMPGAHAIMDHALDLYPEIRTWSKLEKILRNFFWADDMGEHWKGVWEAAMKRREFLLRQRKAQADVVKLEVPQASPEWVKRHVMGAPREMREMGEALGLCPFRPRATSGD